MPFTQIQDSRTRVKASRPFLPEGQVVKPQRSPNEPIFKKEKQKDKGTEVSTMFWSELTPL